MDRSVVGLLDYDLVIVECSLIALREVVWIYLQVCGFDWQHPAPHVVPKDHLPVVAPLAHLVLVLLRDEVKETDFVVKGVHFDGGHVAHDVIGVHACQEGDGQTDGNSAHAADDDHQSAGL